MPSILTKVSYYVVAPILAVSTALFYAQSQLPLNAAGLASASSLIESPCPMVHTPMFSTKKDDTFTKGASHMALMHNAILRGFNSIYQQAPHVKSEDYSDFIGYSLTWHKFVKGHHDDEETNLFPRVEELVGKKGIWDGTHKEHEAFLGGLEKFRKYLDTLSSPSSFSGTELINIMDSFRTPFNDHYHSEIATIAAMSELGDFPEAGPVFAKWGKASIMKAGYGDVVPFLFMNFDRTFEDGMWADWPPMPKLIRTGLVRIGGLLHTGWWKFTSCDINGQPRAFHAGSKS